MIYNLATDLDKHRFAQRCRALIDKGALVDLTEPKRRTKGQNNYLHLLIGVVAIETGCTLAYVKEWYYKRLVNAPIFCAEAEDPFLGTIETLRSSADLTTEEMSESIDRFKRWGNENGFYMPEPGDESLLEAIEAEMARLKKYL